MTTELLDEPQLEVGRRLRVERVATTSELAELCDDWNRLAGDIPFRRWAWLDAWWRHYATAGDDLFVLALYDERERLTGLAPWYRHRSPWFGRVLRFLGSGIVCSDYLTVLSQPADEERVARAISDWLRNKGLHDWDALELEAVDRGDRGCQLLRTSFVQADYAIHERPALNCWPLELSIDWDTYVKTLSGTRRTVVRRLIRDKFATGRAVTKWVESHDDLERAWTILVDLHQRRRKMLGQPGCFASPRFNAFLRLAAERLLAEGRLRLQWIEFDGRPAAVSFDLAGGDTVYMYQSGIEPELMDERPGWLGTIAGIRRATAEGFRCYDFLRGDEPYKASWRAKPRPLVDIRIVADSRAARCRHAIWLTAAQAKGWLKAALNEDARHSHEIGEQRVAKRGEHVEKKISAVLNENRQA